jgi:hypothetical protein
MIPDFKVKIKLPLVDPNGVWRLGAGADAGGGQRTRGVLPTLNRDDEVLVGFIANDPRYPVDSRLACTAGTRLPGIAANSTEQKFGYKSPENQQTCISTTTPKTIKLETGSCSISLDGQSNSIELKVGGNNVIKITIRRISRSTASGQAVVKGNPIMLN